MSKSIDQLLRSIERKTRAEAGMPGGRSAFSKWLDKFIDEKGIDREGMFEVEGRGGPNWMTYEHVLRAMKSAPAHEQASMKSMLVKIDFKNGDVRHYLRHLAGAIAL